MRRYTKDIDNLNERMENLNKELEIVKKSEQQKIQYVERPTTIKEQSAHQNLEEIVQNVDARKKLKKKENCQCNCHIY